MPNFGSAAQFNRIPALQFVAEKSASAPNNPVSGQLWTDTSVTPNKLRWYDGSAWVAADHSSLADGYITDAHINATAAISLSKLAVDPLARANHTGIQSAATISDFDTQVRTNRLDQLANPTANLDLNGVRLTNGATPLAPGDLTTKSYVDNSRAGISVKDPVRVVALGNVNLNNPGSSIDGIALDDGDRFLATAQNTATENGLYVWNGASATATRASDADSTGEIVDGSMVAVAEGSSAGYQYIQTVTASGAPGSWSQDWTVFAIGGQTYTAGNGLTISGTTFSLDAPVTVENGGTGADTAVAARASLGATTKVAADLGALAVGVAYVHTHNLDTTDVVLSLRAAGTGRSVDIDWAPTSANAVTFYPDLAYSAGSLRVVVVG
jgi:hypothetical protein